jgi:hypothetical protein
MIFRMDSRLHGNDGRRGFHNVIIFVLFSAISSVRFFFLPAFVSCRFVFWLRPKAALVSVAPICIFINGGIDEDYILISHCSFVDITVFA